MGPPPIRGTVITDASYCHRSKAAGWGAWISADHTLDKVRKAGVIKGSPSNSTEAELLACMIGIWYAARLGVTEILVQTDCLAVVEVINGVRHAGQSGLRKTYHEGRARHFPTVHIIARHVKGHTTNEDARSWVNRWCDFHAGRNMRAERARRLGPKVKKRRLKHGIR